MGIYCFAQAEYFGILLVNTALLFKTYLNTGQGILSCEVLVLIKRVVRIWIWTNLNEMGRWWVGWTKVIGKYIVHYRFSVVSIDFVTSRCRNSSTWSTD